DESRLLRGRALKDAQIWAIGKSLSDLDYQFLATSVELDRKELQKVVEVERAREIEARLRQERKVAKLQRLLLAVLAVGFVAALGMSLFARRQYRRARISEIIALASSSQGLLASDNQLKAMLDAIKARRRVNDLGGVDRNIEEQVEIALTRAIYGSNEFNQLIGHQGSVLGVDISPDGKSIATASQDRTVKIWRSDGQLLETLPHSATVFRVTFSPDGKSLVSGSLDGTVKLWSTDGKLLQNIPAHDAAVWGVAFSPDGQTIASASSDRTAKLWRKDGRLLTTLKGHERAVWNVAFDATGQIVASAGVDNAVKLWSLDGQLLKTLAGHEAPVWDVAFCQKTNLLVSASSDRTAKLWRLDGTLLRTFRGQEAMSGVDCSENGQYIATGGQDNVIHIWQSDGTLLQILKKHLVPDVVLSADGLMVASASEDGTVKLWRSNKAFSRPLYGHEDTVWDIAVSPDGQLIASAGDPHLRLWGSDGTFLQAIDSARRRVRSVAFAPHEPTAIVGTNKPTVEIWDLGDLAKVRPRPLKILTEHQAAVFAIAVSPDGQIFASGGDDKTIKLWSMDGELLHSFSAHDGRIWKLAFSPDGQILASASEDGTVKLWQPDGKPVAELDRGGGAIWGLAFHPRGNLMVSASRDDTLTFWKLDGGDATFIKTVTARSKGLTRVAFSPDGQIIATAGLDNTVKLWDLDGEFLNVLPGHEAIVTSVTFTADGRSLVAGAHNQKMILWDLEKIETLNKLEYACDWVRDYLRTNVEVEGSDRNLCKNVGN
ncbi:WD40 repeat domain-containing protein, partial [Lyngbya sp. CCY1209]|uniref:WD40 repeat domain-containing protein n=1 Tax=Lyngbya sp. CCY1209 TaxID=2886103 RepID=UPI002D20DF6E